MVACFGAAHASTALPAAVHESCNVQYMAGGIGQAEARAMEQASSRWPVTLEFAVEDAIHGDFAANVDTVVRDTRGRTVLRVGDKGPFVLAKLVPAHQVVDATLDGRRLRRSVDVQTGKPAEAVFEWAANTDRT
jgi:hypothetical protein